MNPFEEGHGAASIFENPYWTNWPKRTTPEDEIAAYKFVDGYVAALQEQAK